MCCVCIVLPAWGLLVGGKLVTNVSRFSGILLSPRPVGVVGA